MKKFGKFIFGTVSVATLACGAYYVYKNLIKKDSSDEFEDFEDEFEDFDSEEEEGKEETDKKDTREYVSINITSDSAAAKPKESTQTEESSDVEKEA
jgi:hypothetical protein